MAFQSIGLETIGWLNAAMILIALATLLFVYCAMRELTTCEMAFFVIVMVAFSSPMHKAAVRLLSDGPFMLLVWFGLLCYLVALRRPGFWLELGTLALVATTWLRVVGIPIALAAAAGLVIESGSTSRRLQLNAGLLAAGTVITVIFFTLYHEIHNPTMVQPSYIVRILENWTSGYFFESLTSSGKHLSELFRST